MRTHHRPSCLGAIALLLAFLAPLHAGTPISLYEFGADDVAYLALPSEAPRAAVLLVPDAYSDADLVAKRCDLLAKLGYVALAIDLYGGQAGDSVRAKQIQERAGTEGSKIIAAALRLLHESPRYRSPRLILAVWGENLPLVHSAILNQLPDAPVVALSWLDAVPQRPEINPESTLLQSWNVPVQILLNQHAKEKDWTTLPPLRKAETELYHYQAPPGFLFTEDSKSIDAWTETIRFWNTAAGKDPAGRQALLPTPPSGVAPAPDSTAPAPSPTPSSPSFQRRPIPPRGR